MSGLVSAGVSLIIGLIVQPVLIPWLRRLGVMDEPNHRSSHEVVTPRGGGLAVMVALGAGLLATQPSAEAGIVYLGCLILGGVGLLDDFRGVSAKTRLVLLLLVGGAAGAALVSPLPWLVAVPALALWTAAYVNAFNFMDGINGISGLSGAVAGAAYAAMGLSFDSPVLVALGGALLGSCTSFLPFNIPSAKVFLGDVGSYGLGFAIAASAWLAWAAGAPPMLALAPTSVYLADTGSTLIHRARRREPLLEAHREHVYQLRVAEGRSHVSVAVAVAAVTSVMVVLVWLSVALDGLPSLLASVAAAGILGWYLGSARRLSRFSA